MPSFLTRFPDKPKTKSHVTKGLIVVQSLNKKRKCQEIRLFSERFSLVLWSSEVGKLSYTFSKQIGWLSLIYQSALKLLLLIPWGRKIAQVMS